MSPYVFQTGRDVFCLGVYVDGLRLAHVNFFKVICRTSDHQVHSKGQRSAGSDTRNVILRRTSGYKVPIHHIHVETIDSGSLKGTDLLAEPGEVHTHYTGIEFNIHCCDLFRFNVAHNRYFDAVVTKDC